MSVKLRNIPAHAGKTICDFFCGDMGKEHPRARGENDNQSTPVAPDDGTSPRTRGKPVPLPPHGGQVGNIPAHAGKTLWRAIP